MRTKYVPVEIRRIIAETAGILQVTASASKVRQENVIRSQKITF